MDGGKEVAKMKVLMLPWLGYGHISPYLELAKALSRRNFDIYLCSTPINLNSIKPYMMPPNPPTSIKLVDLHLPTLEDLPPHYHTTNGLPPHLMSTLKKAFDMSSLDFSAILESLKPDMVIYDFLQPWAPKLAKLSLNIPSILFLSTGATSTAFFGSIQVNGHVISSEKFPFPDIYIRDYEIPKIDSVMETIVNDIRDVERVRRCIEESSDIVLIKTFREIEGKYIDYLSMLYGKKMVPTGPLVQELAAIRNEDRGIMEWLDNKEESSTLFISFGTEFFLSKEDIEEMAHGLELSNVNFIWVLRFPFGEEKKVEDVLPNKFLERMGGRGMVVNAWAPQGRILGHESVGGFVSHCGWSSVMEGMKYGVPIIALPMHIDQPLNARLVEEVGVGEEIIRGKDGTLERQEIARVIRKVVVDECGEVLRRKVKDLSEVMRSKGDEEIDGVVQEILKVFEKNK